LIFFLYQPGIGYLSFILLFPKAIMLMWCYNVSVASSASFLYLQDFIQIKKSRTAAVSGYHPSSDKLAFWTKCLAAKSYFEKCITISSVTTAKYFHFLPF